MRIVPLCALETHQGIPVFMNPVQTNTVANQDHNGQRVLEIAGTLNFRDLGGYTNAEGRVTKWGKVYRSAQLDRLDPAGVSELAKLNFKTVIDLRFSEETELYPTMREAFPEATFFSWHDEAQANNHDSSETPKALQMQRSWRDSLESNDPAQVREAMRVNYPTKLYSHRAIYKRMLLRLIDGDSPLVFHCAAGKDRTGVAAALILSLLGVSNEQIVQDYLLTQQLIEGRMENWLAGGATNSDKYQDFQRKLAEQPSNMLKPVFEADLSYIETLLEYVARTYSSFEAYALQQLQLDQAQLEALRRNLLA